MGGNCVLTDKDLSASGRKVGRQRQSELHRLQDQCSERQDAIPLSPPHPLSLPSPCLCPSSLPKGGNRESELSPVKTSKVAGDRFVLCKSNGLKSGLSRHRPVAGTDLAVHGKQDEKHNTVHRKEDSSTRILVLMTAITELYEREREGEREWGGGRDRETDRQTE